MEIIGRVKITENIIKHCKKTGNTSKELNRLFLLAYKYESEVKITNSIKDRVLNNQELFLNRLSQLLGVK